MDIIKFIISSISPGLRKTFVTFVRSLKSKSSPPPTPLDETVIEYLFYLFDIKD